MKFVVILAACVFAAVVANPAPASIDHFNLDMVKTGNLSQEERSILVNLLIRQLFELIRRVIKNGSSIFGIPVLDPFTIDHYHLVLPAGLINLDSDITNGLLEGIGDFVIHRSNFNRHDISFELALSVPLIKIKAENYRLVGDFYTMVPLYGEGEALFEVENFHLEATLFLKQSEDEKSILIDRIENPNYSIGALRSQLTGVIGGGEEIDAISNSVVSEVIFSYMNRFSRAISILVSHGIVEFGNPLLNHLDSWRYIQLIL